MRTRTSGPSGAAGLSGSSKSVTDVGVRRGASDELDAGHGRVVALARPELEDPRVAAVAVGVARADLGEELVRHLAVAEEGHDLADQVDSLPATRLAHASRCT